MKDSVFPIIGLLIFIRNLANVYVGGTIYIGNNVHRSHWYFIPVYFW